MFEYDHWDQSEHYVDADGKEIKLPPLYLDGLRLRMAVLACRIWPDPKAKARAQLIADRDEYEAYHHSSRWGRKDEAPLIGAALSEDVRFFRTPCRLLQIAHDGFSWGTTKRFDSMMVFVLRSSRLDKLDKFGSFPFRPRSYNGKTCIPIPRFLAELRPVVRIQIAKGRHMGRFGATVIFPQ